MDDEEEVEVVSRALLLFSWDTCRRIHIQVSSKTSCASRKHTPATTKPIGFMHVLRTPEPK